MRILLIVLAVAGVVVFAILYLMGRRPPRDSEGHRRSATDADVTRRVAEVVDPLRQPTVLLRKINGESRSYLGGVPPTYPGFAWPVKGSRPLGFLACIDLSEIPTVDWLPKAGLLLFFYDLDKQPWGFDPADRGSWAVMHVPDTSAVTGVASFPDNLDSNWRLPTHSVTFEVASIPPPWELAPLESPALSDEQTENLINALEGLREAEYGDSPKHQVGGFPEPVQNAEMDLECQLASSGIYVGDPSGYKDPRAEALRAGASGWRLLLQVDSDDDLNVMWGDGGLIYFWVREEEARKGDFSGTWLILQCH